MYCLLKWILLTIQLFIRPPWYREGWAILCYVAIVVGLIVWCWRLWVNRRKLESRLEEERKEAEIYRNKLAEMVQAQELEREKAAHERELSRMKLEELTHRLIEKSQRLEALEKTTNGNGHDASPGTSQLRFSRLLTPEDWAQFQVHFDRVHPGFLERLTDQFDFLTPAETRLVVLMKLGLSTAESASMLGVSPDSFKKTRHRLRKKLETKGTSFEDLMMLDR